GFTQETEDLQIEVDDKREEVLAALSARRVNAREEGALMVVENAGDAAYDAIRDALAETGARLRRLSPRRRSLTEIFQDEA
ncbi:MAG: ABC transporter ATP-binding protein, partial [Chloroflexota bacterium]|nr:ABC transporter ATP-binding protein [Chloroflexota bacterium]